MSGDEAPQHDDRSGKILGYIFSIAGLAILVRLAAFVEKQFMAHYFGTGADLDAFTVALSVPMMVLFMVTAVANPTILPMFVRRSQGDGRGAWGQANAWALALLLLLASGAVASLGFSGGVARLLAPGFDASTRQSCAAMLRILVPVSVLMGLLPLTTSLLNAEKKFVFVPLGELLMKLTTIAALAFFAKGMGIRALVWGTVAASGAALSLHVWVLKTSWLAHRSAPRFSDPDFRFVLFLMLAPALGTGFSQFGSVIENAASSTLATGTVASLAFARKIVNLPLLIVPVATGTVLFTFFAELTHRDEHESTARLLAAGMRTMLFLFLPLAILTCVLAEPIVAVVYQRGAFDAESTALVSTLLFWLAPSMCFYALEMMLMRHFFAREDLWTPILIGMACVVLRIALIFAAVRPFGVVGIAGAIVVSRCVKVAFLTYFVCRRGHVTLRHLDIKEAFKVVPAAVLTGAVAFAVLQQAGPALGGSLAGRCLLLALAGGAGGIAYLGATYILGVSECRYMIRGLRWGTS